MYGKSLLCIISILLYGAIFAYNAFAATIHSASCTRTAVMAAYSTAVDGDIIMIPTGDCQSLNRWASRINITKKITIQGNGVGSTIIGILTGGGFNILSDGVAITGIQFNGNYSATDPGGPGGVILIGNLNTCPVGGYKDWRLFENMFVNFGSSTANTLGRNAITITGASYGVIDHNVFNDCNGECIDISQDGVAGTTRSNIPGQYSNGTVFIEDNVFNATNTNGPYENTVDGSSSQRFTFRYNTINISDGVRYGSGIVSTHETCVLGTGSSSTCGDAGSAAFEMYNNTINLNATGRMRDLGIVRSGRALIYNNNITGIGNVLSRTGSVASWVSNYRSFNSYGGTPTWCSNATHARGYSGACHEVDGSYTTEGLDVNKTTLSGAIDATQTTITVSSTMGISSNGIADGFSIKIDNEQIDYTGVSGNQLTGCTRGVNGTLAVSHSSGVPLNYLKFGRCLEQINNVWIWGNAINGLISNPMNRINICGYSNGCVGSTGPDYTFYDIQSYTQRPNNWQYRNDETAYTYTPFPYPHPLTLGRSNGVPVKPSAPSTLTIY